jgi:NAD(P)H-hydrate repair Nnr-like enzyme with NAD(P)H-hydrate dehydratase domain
MPMRSTSYSTAQTYVTCCLSERQSTYLPRAARLLNITTKEVQDARIISVQEIAKRYHGSVVLKGANSLVVTYKGKVWQNKTGNHGMSSAGMGDVLSGIIAAFIAQGMTVDNALLLAVHLHGATGDAFSEEIVGIHITATENIEWTRRLLKQ